MSKYEEIYEVVKNTLSEKRFYHSVCVVERAVELAKIYGADIEKAKLAGIIHDIAKEVKEEDRIKNAESYGIELDEVEKKSTGIIHAKVGAKIAEVQFGLDEEVCNAVAYHTTARANMTLLEKIIYLADYSGKDRHFEDTNYIYELANKDLDEAMRYCLAKTINEVIGKKSLLHIKTVEAYNYFNL
jgi:predicted HD superfamily hydrolase involved in NAD metabolism